MRRILRSILGLLTLTTPVTAQQLSVGTTVTDRGSAVAQAEVLMEQGQVTAATELLGTYLGDHPTDGRAWFYLGRIYLDQLRHWHLRGHSGDPSGAVYSDIAGVAFDQAVRLLTDSGSVFGALVAVERATTQIEERGWFASMARPRTASELPIPPVVAELGRNLIGSCPANGVMLTGSDVELAAVWGVQLQGGTRDDLMLLRPDRYQDDLLYRVQMARALSVAAEPDLRALISRVRTRRPVCLTPTLDSMIAPGAGWRPSQMVLVAGTPTVPDSAATRLTGLSIHELGRIGLAGSVWSAAVRDLYQSAAEVNPALCRLLVVRPDSFFPAIAACRE